MFRHLADFGHQRTLVQAIGFYLVYFILGIAIAAVLGALVAPLTGLPNVEGGLMIGTIFAVVACPALSFVILYQKGLLRHAGYLLVAVLSVAGAAIGGLLLGLVLLAFLTTRRSVGQPDVVEAGPTFA